MLAAAFFLGVGTMLGATLFPDEGWPWRAYCGTLTVAAGTIVLGAGVYYIYALTPAATAGVILSVSGAAWATRRALTRRERVFHAGRRHQAPEGSPWRSIAGAAAAAAMLGMTAYCFATLAAAATDGAMRSPWDVVPRMFFALFFFAALGTMAAAAGGLAPRLALIPASALALLAVGVTATVYAVGYGFDPFIHQATELAIFRDGVVTPKPFYYVGQYAFVTVLARMLGGAVTAIDAWLVPVAFALVVPCAYWSLRKALDLPASACAVAAASLLLLPLSSFVATTPQGFANAVVLLTVFLALPAVTRDAFPRPVLWLMALAATAIHPLAGIPLMIFVALVSCASPSAGGGTVRRFAFWQVAILGSIALPVMFVLNSLVSGAGVAVDLEALRSPAAIIDGLQATPVATRQFMAAYDFTYAWKAWRATAIIAAAAAGFWIAWKRSRATAAYAAAALALFANYVLLKSVVRFPFLIAYERSSYADRIAELALFVLAPMAAVALASLAKRVTRAGALLRIFLVTLLAAFATSSLYLAYPRRDKYESSRGWSTSAADVEAVRLINKDAAGRPYVVLANQSTSAAAVREFGFKRYYPSRDPKRPGPLFFYPIPTGDALYEEFLAMNEAFGSRAAAEKAMDLTGVDTIYYVVSYYWWNAQRIVLSARKQADRQWNVADRAYVFKYER